MEQKKEVGLANTRGQGGGTPARLNQFQRQDLARHLRTESKFWTVGGVRTLIAVRYAVYYGKRQVQRLLRRLGLYCYKPQPRDYRQPVNAAQKLSERLKAVADVLRLRGYDINEVCLGFADESSMQLQANSQRLWAFAKRLTRRVNTDRKKLNCFGFYALQGSSVLEAIPKGNQENLVKVLPLIRAANPRAKAIVLLWDNHPAHLTKNVQQCAHQLGIVLVNLPAYSPNLNPIERIWKQIKKIVSQQDCLSGIEQLEGIVRQSFQHYSGQLSFAKRWIECFWTPLSSNYPTSSYNKL